jgi:hypothetical protein
MFTVFANMRVNSDERLHHMRESFESFESESDDWLINIRGSKREQALAFLRERLGTKATFFELLDDSRGWITNAQEMLAKAKYDYVLLWVEDHINISPKGHLQQVVSDMRKQRVDNLTYSWWNVGWKPSTAARQKEFLELKKTGTIEWSDIDAPKWQKVMAINQAPYAVYLVSIVSIFRKDFFEGLMRKDHWKLPLALNPFIFRFLTLLQRLGVRLDQKRCFDRINSVLFHKLRLFAKETPFDLEKRPNRYDLLPVRTAFPLQELFVCIDDDSVREPHGYSLISRGEYPFKDRLLAWDVLESPQEHEAVRMKMRQGESKEERYVFYGMKGTRSMPVREYLKVLQGQVRVTVSGETMMLSAGEGAAYYTNVPHEIFAVSDAELVKHVPKTGLAPHYFSA